MLRLLRITFLFSLMIASLAVLYIWLSIIPTLPHTKILTSVHFQVPLRIYSAEGSLISEFGTKKRLPTKITHFHPLLLKAVISVEDQNFYEHSGVDWWAILRAMISYVGSGGEKKQGGGTITMQVARNFFLTREKTFIRKFREILLALKIERELNKEKILELYLNKVFLGQRAYGMAAAAQVYYGRDSNELSLAELAMLAGLAQKPSVANPITNPKKAIDRRNHVLHRMHVLAFISEADYMVAKKAPITASLHDPKVELEAPYFAELIRQKLLEEYGDATYTDGLVVTTTLRDKHQIAAYQAVQKNLLNYDARHGYRGAEHHYDIKDNNTAHYDQYLKEFSSIGPLHPALVIAVQQRSIIAYLSGIGEIEITWSGLRWARSYINENQIGAPLKTARQIVSTGDVIRVMENNDGHWQLSQIPTVESAFVSLDPNTGAILSLIGGFNFYQNNYNHVTQARRQAGSSFKTFIYSAALAAGKTTATVINDAPITIDIPGIGTWRPQNYSKKYYGPTLLREALRHSRNIVAIRLLQDIGVSFAIEHIEKFGFNKNELPKSLSLALGSAEIRPIDLARGYAVFANGGYLIEPHFITAIETYNKRILYSANVPKICKNCDNVQNLETDIVNPIIKEDDPIKISNTEETHHAKRVIDARNAWLINSLTQDVIKNGTGRRALVLDRNDLSGKTGTTNDQYDAWFAGYNNDLVAVCWVGFDQFSPLGKYETGSKTALPAWIDYMRIALSGAPMAVMEKPAGLMSVRIDRHTGKRIPTTSPNAIFEDFRMEYVPKEGLLELPSIDSIYNKAQKKEQLF